ncbi:copper chaperone PCu(A)C [Paracoccaceae bacterium GXU_MW_L88]
MKTTLFAALAATIALPAFAHDGLAIVDAYARSGGPAPTGAAYMVIENHTDTDDRLIGATTDVAGSAELHTTIMEDGIARMRPLEDGAVIPAEGEHALERGGDHIMMFGVTGLEDGQTFPLTLIFETAGEMTVDVTVDNARMPEDAGEEMDHENMDHQPEVANEQ